MTKISHLLMVAISVLSAKSPCALSKGIEDLQPRSDAEKVEDAASAASEKKETISDQPNNVTSAPIEGDSSSATETPAAVTKSALSLKIEDKLALGLSAGYITIPHAKNNDFAAFSGADLFVHWKFHSSAGQSVSGSLRYLPIDAETRINGKSYRAIIEGYFVGCKYDWSLFQNTTVFGGVELGYLIVHLNSVDRFPVSSSDEANKFAYGITTGIDWQTIEKIKVGPRINVALGDYQIMQYAGALTVQF